MRRCLRSPSGGTAATTVRNAKKNPIQDCVLFLHLCCLCRLFLIWWWRQILLATECHYVIFRFCSHLRRRRLCHSKLTEVNPLKNTLCPLATSPKMVPPLSRNWRRFFEFLPSKTFYDNPPCLRGISTGVLIKSNMLHIFDVHRFCCGCTLHECTTIDTIKKQLQAFWVWWTY